MRGERTIKTSETWGWCCVQPSRPPPLRRNVRPDLGAIDGGEIGRSEFGLPLLADGVLRLVQSGILELGADADVVVTRERQLERLEYGERRSAESGDCQRRVGILNQPFSPRNKPSYD